MYVFTQQFSDTKQYYCKLFKSDTLSKESVRLTLSPILLIGKASRIETLIEDAFLSWFSTPKLLSESALLWNTERIRNMTQGWAPSTSFYVLSVSLTMSFLVTSTGNGNIWWHRNARWTPECFVGRRGRKNWWIHAAARLLLRSQLPHLESPSHRKIASKCR